VRYSRQISSIFFALTQMEPGSFTPTGMRTWVEIS
jgi:hypothetical protein